MFAALLNILFPKHCAGCRKLGVYICNDCAKALRHSAYQSCIVCGKPHIYGITHAACRKKWGVDAHLHIFHYNTPLKRIIASVKYHAYVDALHWLLWRFRLDIYEHICLWRNLKLVSEGTIVIPIPLHRKRLRQRGFNQSDVVAKALCEITGLELRHLLTREKNTVQIAKLPHDNTRAKQIKGAFVCVDAKPVPESVILVDDVVTTGATVQEAAKTLKRAGVERVLVFSIA